MKRTPANRAAILAPGFRVSQRSPIGDDQQKRQPLALRLSASRAGRMLLHAGTFIRSRKNLRWHLRCIFRDLILDPATAFSARFIMPNGRKPQARNERDTTIKRLHVAMLLLLLLPMATIPNSGQPSIPSVKTAHPNSGTRPEPDAELILNKSSRNYLTNPVPPLVII